MTHGPRARQRGAAAAELAATVPAVVAALTLLVAFATLPSSTARAGLLAAAAARAVARGEDDAHVSQWIAEREEHATTHVILDDDWACATVTISMGGALSHVLPVIDATACSPLQEAP